MVIGTKKRGSYVSGLIVGVMLIHFWVCVAKSVIEHAFDSPQDKPLCVGHAVTSLDICFHRCTGTDGFP